MRVARFVVMPEWQGCGIGLRFLNEVCKIQFTDINRHYKRVNCVYINTSHPGLCSLLRRDKNWIQISQMQGGSHKGKSINSVLASKNSKKTIAGYGGHLRSVQGFKYINKA